ncbi:MAG: hypothetical protein ABTQ29_01245 [Siculibacillus sp.]
MRALLPLALVLALPTGSALADTWTVAEGPKGATTGQWKVTVTDGVVTGEAMMLTADHKPLKYGVSGKITGESVEILRTSAPGGQSCTYTGTIDAKAAKKKFLATGTSQCGSVSGFWKAEDTAEKK